MIDPVDASAWMTDTTDTVDEAAEKWCPFARAYDSTENGGAISSNRPFEYDRAFGDERTAINCIGSRCMAWRWYEPGYGYCGLVGRP